MEVTVQLTDLSELHPRLLWDDIMAAAAIVLGEQTTPPFHLSVEVVGLPSFDDSSLDLIIQTDGLNPQQHAKRRRTYEPARLVELAAIALAGLVIYHAGGHEIRDLAAGGTRADYVVDEARHLLEVTGRSRRGDFETAWHNGGNA
jgi:hypothetical protein